MTACCPQAANLSFIDRHGTARSSHATQQPHLSRRPPADYGHVPGPPAAAVTVRAVTHPPLPRLSTGDIRRRSAATAGCDAPGRPPTGAGKACRVLERPSGAAHPRPVDPGASHPLGSAPTGRPRPRRACRRRGAIIRAAPRRRDLAARPPAVASRPGVPGRDGSFPPRAAALVGGETARQGVPTGAAMRSAPREPLPRSAAPRAPGRGSASHLTGADPGSAPPLRPARTARRGRADAGPRTESPGARSGRD